MQSMEIRSGWPTFAGVVSAVVGLFNVLSGIAAIAEDDQTELINEVLFGVDITAWGWFWLIIGIIQVVAAVLIFQRNAVGQMIALAGASISATLAVFLIFVTPIWA